MNYIQNLINLFQKIISLVSNIFTLIDTIKKTFFQNAINNFNLFKNLKYEYQTSFNLQIQSSKLNIDLKIERHIQFFEVSQK